MKIVLTDCKTITNGDIDLDILKEFGEVIKYELTDYNEIADRIADADAVICNKTILNAETMKKASNLKYIGLFATGYNNIDIEYADEHGITVCNAGSYSTDAVAQHTFAMILNHYNNVGLYDAFVKNGGWKQSTTFSPFVFPLTELRDKTIGIIGYGSIGRKVADIASAFSMKVLIYTRTTKKEDRKVTFVSLDELLQKSDIVTVHCPLNKDSEKMFNKKTFSKMKEGAYFINTARGGIIIEDDLIDSLNSGHLSGAAIDVLETEPMSRYCRLTEADNITLTPHIAWAPIETRKRLIKIVADNIRNYINGTPINVVNKI
ncbi:MAG: D-2-hydroxyacid dehydrogenase [Eubacterium sp.]